MILKKSKFLNKLFIRQFFKTMETSAKKIVLDPFCYPAFKPKTDGSAAIIDYDMEKFTEKINEFYIQNKDTELKDGYAPFCKHLFVENFTSAISGTLEITDDNRNLLRSGYEARREEELAVLCRWFPKELLGDGLKSNIAKYLDIILYSYDQVQAENEAMKMVDPNKDIHYDYAIISVKPQDVNKELPMQPITIMRNALGKEYGGSSVPLDPEKYKQSVDFWENNALIK